MTTKRSNLDAGGDINQRELEGPLAARAVVHLAARAVSVVQLDPVLVIEAEVGMKTRELNVHRP